MADEQSPKMGEQTKGQFVSGAAFTIDSVIPLGVVDSGSFVTYRLMRCNPTIALGRAFANAPIRNANWTLEVEDGVSEKWEELVNVQMERLWPTLIEDILLAKDYGFQAFEKVWEVEKGQLVYKKLKPLIPDITRVKIDHETGSFAGLLNRGEELEANKSFL